MYYHILCFSAITIHTIGKSASIYLSDYTKYSLGLRQPAAAVPWCLNQTKIYIFHTIKITHTERTTEATEAAATYREVHTTRWVYVQPTTCEGGPRDEPCPVLAQLHPGRPPCGSPLQSGALCSPIVPIHRSVSRVRF